MTTSPHRVYSIYTALKEATNKQQIQGTEQHYQPSKSWSLELVILWKNVNIYEDLLSLPFPDEVCWTKTGITITVNLL